MGVLKFLVWTGCAMGLGVLLATAESDGRTPLEDGQREWKRQARPVRVENRVEQVKTSFADALDSAETTVKRAGKQAVTAAAGEPRERITHEDRAAIERIIAQKK